jgi:hypothetical protein
MPVATPHHHPTVSLMSVNGSQSRNALPKAEYQTSYQSARDRFLYCPRNVIADRNQASVPDHITREWGQALVASLSSVVWNHRLTMQAHASRGAQGLGGLPATWRRLLMTDKRFTDRIEEKLALIVPTLNTIAFGGDQPYLCELQTLLRQHLISLVGLFERDPGLDAATADLYAAAAAIVQDTALASQPLARKRRLLKEAQERFHGRIAAARPNGRRACATWRQNELFLAA